MAKHMLIKLLIDVDSDRLGLVWLGLAWFAFDIVSKYEHNLIVALAQTTHKTYAGQCGWTLNNMVVVGLAWLRLPFFKHTTIFRSTYSFDHAHTHTQKCAFVKMKQNKIYWRFHTFNVVDRLCSYQMVVFGICSESYFVSFGFGKISAWRNVLLWK